MTVSLSQVTDHWQDPERDVTRCVSPACATARPPTTRPSSRAVAGGGGDVAGSGQLQGSDGQVRQRCHGPGLFLVRTCRLAQRQDVTGDGSLEASAGTGTMAV